MGNPLISVVICAHNRAKFLPETLSSAFAQTYSPIEILVYDDGSTDGTPELMRSYGDQVRYVWRENVGVARARTAACRLARGEYIAFLDDDDIMVPERVAVLYDALQRYPQAVLASGDWATMDVNGNPLGHRWLPENYYNTREPMLFEDGYAAVVWPKIPSSPITSLFKKVDGERIGWFDEHFSHAAEDKDFLARLALTKAVVYVPRLLAYYRKGHNSQTQADMGAGSFHWFTKHIRMLNHDRSNIRQRLQKRLRLALTLIYEGRKAGLNTPIWLPKDHEKIGLKLIGHINVIRYIIDTRLKLYIKQLIKR
jgi:glycosyltransferase involved in cell wall biosynthesis